MAKTFGEAFTSLPGSKTGHGTHFMRAWEAKKKAFDGKDLDESEQIPLPALGRALEKLDMTPAEYDFEDHCVLLPRQDRSGPRHGQQLTSSGTRFSGALSQQSMQRTG